MSLYVQIHSEPDPSHVEDADDFHGTAHQNVPVVKPGQDAVPPQSLEVSSSIVIIISLWCIAEKNVAEMSAVLVHMWQGTGAFNSVNSFLYLSISQKPACTVTPTVTID